MFRFNHKLLSILKQTGIYLLMFIGIAVDFAIQWPFMVICTIENRFRKRTS